MIVKITYIEIKAFFLIGVRILRPLLEVKYLPESYVFVAHVNHLKVLAGALILLQESNVFLSCRHVRGLVGWQNFCSYPQVELVLRLDNCDTARVQAVVARTVLIHIRDHQLAYDTLRVIFLVAHNAEYARINR